MDALIRKGILLYLIYFVGSTHLHAQLSNPSSQLFAFSAYDSLFYPKVNYQAASENWAISHLDIDNDGDQDLIVAPKKSNFLEILINDGQAQFNEKKRSVAITGIRTLTTLDVNKDGLTDLVGINVSGNIVVFLNNGNGNLEKSLTFNTAKMASHIVSGDLNKDGIYDLVCVVPDRNMLNIHYGKSNGKFKSRKKISTGDNPRVAQIEDIDKDGLNDIIVGCEDNSLYIYYGNQKNKYNNYETLPSEDAIWALKVKDLNNDSVPDIAAATENDKQLYIYLNEGNRAFRPKQQVPSGDHHFDLVINDFDSDGDQDIITCSKNDNAIHLHLNDSNGIFDKGITVNSGNWNAALVEGDFNGDGNIDIASASVNDKSINIHINRGSVFAQETAVYGKVMDNDTNQPLPNADIELRDSTNVLFATIKTDASGAYTYTLPIGEPFELSISAQGYTSTKTNVILKSENYPQGLKKDLILLKQSPEGSKCIQGKVNTSDMQVFSQNIAAEVTNNQGELVAEVPLSSEGSFEFSLPVGQYNFSINHPDYFSVNQPISILPNAPTEVGCIQMEMQMQSVSNNMAASNGNEGTYKSISEENVDNVYYDVDKYSLRRSGYEILNKLVYILTENPSYSVEIASHADSDGTEMYNMGLSQKRAQTIIEYLQQNGISTGRIISNHFGESRPAVPNDSTQNKQLNRRTEFLVVKST